MSEIKATKRKAKREGKDVCTDFVIVDNEEKPQEVVRILDGDPIRKLFNRGTITEAQFLAAERLYSDWYIGGMSPRVTKPFKPREIDEGTHEHDVSDYKIDAMDRCFAAMKYLRSKQLQNVVEEVVFETQNVKTVASAILPNENSGLAKVKIIDRLNLALDLLVEFYEGK